MATATATMKAARIHSFGGPDVIRYEEAPVPNPTAGEVLVRIHAAGVNPVDWKIREGHIGERRFPLTLGNDFSGEVQEAGSEANGYQLGDEVFGDVRTGSYAQLGIATIDSIARKPADLEHEAAASLPIAALTAWQALEDVAGLRAGQSLLVHAAAGGVGGFAVQFAKLKGARVIGTASGDHAQEVKSLGADVVIDYRTTPFEQVAGPVDVILDTVGGDTQDRSWQLLKPGGILVSLVRPPPAGAAESRKARGTIMRRRSDPRQLGHIGGLVAGGKVKVTIAAKFPLAEARQAQEMSQEGHTVGKIVLVVPPPG